MLTYLLLALFTSFLVGMECAETESESIQTSELLRLYERQQTTLFYKDEELEIKTKCFKAHRVAKEKYFVQLRVNNHILYDNLLNLDKNPEFIFKLLECIEQSRKYIDELEYHRNQTGFSIEAPTTWSWGRFRIAVRDNLSSLTTLENNETLKPDPASLLFTPYLEKVVSRMRDKAITYKDKTYFYDGM